MAQKGGGGGGGGANNGVPVVTSVTPNSGPANVYMPITITGSGFTGTSAISIGGTSLGTGDWVVVNDTTITTKTPQGAAGPVSVQVTTSGGTSAANKLLHLSSIAAGHLGNPTEHGFRGGWHAGDDHRYRIHRERRMSPIGGVPRHQHQYQG